ncbi:MAG TPA: hypothetical protein VH591_03805 [Ktedonobacterales bacterium]
MPGTDGEARGRSEGRHRAMRLVGLVALAVLVAGCGVTTANGGELASGTPSATVSATATATASPAPPSAPTPTRTATGGNSAVACPGSNQGPGQPTLILTPTTPDRTGSAHVGDIVQVRLPTSSKWTYAPAQSSGALSPTQPSGVLIRSLNSCVWSFKAVADGTQTLMFSGQAICKPGQPCADYRIAMTFTITVS